jgi:hypothetical protein
LDPAAIQTLLASTAPVTTGMTVGEVVDAAFTTVDLPTLIQLIQARQQSKAKAAAMAGIPLIPVPANAAAIYAYVLNTTTERDYSAALQVLLSAAQGASASPVTNTWDDVFKALLYLAISASSAIPHLGGA